MQKSIKTQTEEIAQEEYRRRYPTIFHTNVYAIHRLFTLLPDLLQKCACPVLCLLPDPPPVRLIYASEDAFELSVPSVLGHLSYAYGHYAVHWLGLGLSGLVEVGEDQPLLAQEGGLLCAVLRVHGDGEVEHGRGKGHASKLLTLAKAAVRDC
jgi:hypothetical protein